MPRGFKTQKIKFNKAYQVDELANAAGVSIATVRNWLKAGMPCIDDSRPIIIMGFQALSFLNTRKNKAKCPLKPGELYCMRCKAAKMPLGAMADYVPSSATGGRLKALCEACECPCNRNISAQELLEFHKVLDVATRGN